MRLAVISDIHGNLDAFEAVLAQIRQEGVDAVVHLGDLVGYNANPNECVELLQSENIWNVAGNHDLALFDQDRAQYFNIIAHQAIVWCREQLSPENQEAVRRLPMVWQAPGQFLACHGSPTSPDSYISQHFQGKRAFNHLIQQDRQRVCFFGHTHRRALWYRDIRGKVALREVSPGRLQLPRDCHFLINPGSVGQPRDGNPDAAYLIFDFDHFTVEFKTIPYDVGRAQRRILEAGLPPYLAERLARGV
jgi:putative phosphoesterase